jgi:hypothetical protein
MATLELMRNARLRTALANSKYLMLNQRLENIGEGLLHACISIVIYS